MSYILMIDDDFAQSQAIEGVLDVHNHKVIIVTNETQMIRQLQKEVPDLVLVNFALSEVDVPELITRFKGDKRCENIPLISIINEAQQDENLSDLNEISDDWIVQPVDSGTLIEKINKLLDPDERRRSPRYRAQFRIDYLVLHPTKLLQIDGALQTTTVNVADGGVAFVSPQVLPTGSLCALAIYPPCVGTPFLVIGKVIWQKELHNQKIAVAKWVYWRSEKEKALTMDHAGEQVIDLE